MQLFLQTPPARHSLLSSSYLNWGQTWASGWRFRSVRLLLEAHHLQTRVQARYRTCRKGPAIVPCTLITILYELLYLTRIIALIYWLQTYLEGSQSLHHLGDAVFSDGFCESRPGRRVGKLGAAGEQRVVALGAHVYTCRRQVVLESAMAF